ncbi:MAG: Eco57I restriction-modification methylase domain-containing protein [Bacteroidaceae bacterium]|nr:Eco57I restriction-modification methylase domain-containing protein [Bacteroidaceae bacterium]
MKHDTYNPDVLNCLANLSNDEVFTPPSLANQVLDLLPQELFTSPTTTFLDPVSKSGVFLREIVKRLDRGLSAQIPNRQERIDHILRRQVFGIAITELTAHLSRRSVYCSKDASSPYSVTRFKTESGNILYRPLRHTWANGKCRYCGASQEVYDRGSQAEQYAYQFIHTDNPHTLFNNMKFDVIIGNPPYQLSDGGNAASAIPLYHNFVEQAKKLQPNYLCMIIPARWYAGGRGLDSFRAEMLSDKHISHLIDFADSSECFPGVNIAGGICYFLWDKKYSGNCMVCNMNKGEQTSIRRNLSEYSVFVRSNLAIDIIRKIHQTTFCSLSTLVYPSNPFGFRTYIRGGSKPFEGAIKLLTSEGFGYIKRSEISKSIDAIDTYNVIMTRAMSGGNKPGSDGKYQIVPATMRVMEQKEICAETYICIGSFKSKTHAQNLQIYLTTKFSRFLMLQAMSSIMINKDAFQFVPLQDFSHPWTDEMLYKKYGLTEEEIDFIESMIRPME